MWIFFFFFVSSKTLSCVSGDSETEGEHKGSLQEFKIFYELLQFLVHKYAFAILTVCGKKMYLTFLHVKVPTLFLALFLSRYFLSINIFI